MTRPEWRRDFPRTQVLPSSVRPSYRRHPAGAKAPSFIHRVVTVAKLKAPDEMQEKAYLMFIYDGATCVFRSIIHYRDDNSWASVRWSVNSKGGGVRGERCEEIKEDASVQTS